MIKTSLNLNSLMTSLILILFLTGLKKWDSSGETKVLFRVVMRVMSKILSNNP